MSGESHTVNSEHSWTAFCANARALYDEHKYVTWSYRIGPDRSLNQNALFYVWLTEYAAHLMGVDKKQITAGIVEGMKRTVKARFYAETNQSFMIHRVYSPLTRENKKDYTSSGKWKAGEMFMVLEWLQMSAANDGVILEAKGEYAKLKRKQDET